MAESNGIFGFNKQGSNATYAPPVSPSAQLTPAAAPMPTQPVQAPQPLAPAPVPAAGGQGANLKPKTKLKIDAKMIAVIILGVVGLTLAILLVVCFMSYNDVKSNADAQTQFAVAEAVKAQADKDAADFAEREKNPNLQFNGPEVFGSLEFQYPRTWSMYVADDATDGSDYEAYLNPVSVPTVDLRTVYALRVHLMHQDYDTVVRNYDAMIAAGQVGVSEFTVDGMSGIRLDGSLDIGINGSAIILRVRDKTVMIRTDAEVFKSDFDKLISTIRLSL